MQLLTIISGLHECLELEKCTTLESLHLLNHKLKYFKQWNFFYEEPNILSQIYPVKMKKFGKCPVFLHLYNILVNFFRSCLIKGKYVCTGRQSLNMYIVLNMVI